MKTLFMQSAAGFSDCGLYRYWLSRVWDKELPSMCWLMLNPSTATATEDDNTIRRCMSFAQSWGYGGIHVVNLFAFRATDPYDMHQAVDPVGPDNDDAIRTAVKLPLTVVAWGAQMYSWKDRHTQVVEMLQCMGISPKCLGLTAGKQPRHPLYVKGDTPLIDFPEATNG